MQQKLDFLDTPMKVKPRGKKRKSRSTGSESDAYVNENLSQSENSNSEPLSDEVRQDISELRVPKVKHVEISTNLPTERFPLPSTSGPVSQPSPTYAQQSRLDPSAHEQEVAVCAMCGNIHQGTCGMTERSENLVHYRQILLTNQTDEPFDDRVRPLNI
jgi:hypothetical protein